jgi:hypothetical protein
MPINPMTENPYQSPVLAPENSGQHQPDPERLPTLAFRGSLLLAFLCVVLFLAASTWLPNDLGELLQRGAMLGLMASLVALVISSAFVSSAQRVKEANRRIRVRFRLPPVH